MGSHEPGRPWIRVRRQPLLRPQHARRDIPSELLAPGSRLSEGMAVGVAGRDASVGLFCTATNLLPGGTFSPTRETPRPRAERDRDAATLPPGRRARLAILIGLRAPCSSAQPLRSSRIVTNGRAPGSFSWRLIGAERAPTFHDQFVDLFEAHFQRLYRYLSRVFGRSGAGRGCRAGCVRQAVRKRIAAGLAGSLADHRGAESLPERGVHPTRRLRLLTPARGEGGPRRPAPSPDAAMEAETRGGKSPPGTGSNAGARAEHAPASGGRVQLP